MLDDLPVDDPDEIEDVGAHRPAGRLVAHERPVVCPGADHAEPDLVAVDGELLDHEVEVGKRTAQGTDHCSDACLARRVVRAEVLVLDELGGRQLVGDLEVPLVEALLDQAAHDDFGGCRHGLSFR